MVDRKEFFRQATLRICGNLQIEEALFSTFQFLKEIMPVDMIFLQFVEEDQTAYRTVAIATEKEGKAIDTVVPLSPEAQQVLQHYINEYLQHHEPNHVWLFDKDPKSQSVTREVFDFHGKDATSLMVMPLEAVKDKVVGGGSLWLSTQGARKFTQQHADLLSLLREPFALAMSNALRHRSELKLYGREFFWEATRRICGNLDIEEAMVSTLNFLNRTMPATMMFLERYEEKLGATRTIAKATLEKGEAVDLLTPLSPEASKWATQYYQEASKKVYLYEHPETRPLASEMMRFHNISLSSVILLPLVTGGQVVGSMIIGSETEDTFTQEQADRILLLSEPFAIAMSNALRHRSEIKLHDREFFWEATMRICGSLEIEEGLRACVEYLAEHMPADCLYLERYEHDLGSMRVVARASAKKGEKMDVLLPLPEEGKAAMLEGAQAIKAGTFPTVHITNKPMEEPVARALFEALGEPSSSILGMPLVLGGQMEGALVLLAEGEDRFDEHHAQHFANLKVPFFVAMSNTMKHREILKLKDLLADDNRYLQGELRRLSGDEIIGANFGLKNVMHKVKQVASLDSPVLLLGETGVGKDVIANTIHYSSSRSGGPFVSVNCGAIPDTLIDSELFGHEKGAFTGALTQKRGRFERADKGTIFLDEIGELPPQAQVRLLRVLQSREIERVGGDKTIPLDIRIIAATNRDLEEMVHANTFREDLWFRLNVFPVWMPPLRERAVDIPALLQHFINLKSKELNLPAIPTVSHGAVDALMQYHWPGNVRELENIVERAIILNAEGPLTFDMLNLSGKDEAPAQLYGREKLDEVISAHIQGILSRTEGKIHGPGGAADLLGINPSTLRNRMNKLGIKYGRGRK